jgi:hypothetical protein
MSVVITAKGFYVEANAQIRFWPELTSRDVRYVVAIRGKADLSRTLLEDRC